MYFDCGGEEGGETEGEIDVEAMSSKKEST